MQTSSQTIKNHNVEELVTRLKAIDGGFYYVFTIIAYKSVVSSLYHVVGNNTFVQIS